MVAIALVMHHPLVTNKFKCEEKMSKCAIFTNFPQVQTNNYSNILGSILKVEKTD